MNGSETRRFSSFFCLLGAGVVGSLVALMSSDLMDTHEKVMKEKMMKLSKEIKMYLETSYTKVKETSVGEGAMMLISVGGSGASALSSQLTQGGIIAENGATMRTVKDMRLVFFDKLLFLREDC